ncbi:hypothetical protein CC85DRAFT_283249 [Cutaneotrichosporon oleaginosum]|uniref:DNA replication regulator Sld3 C-terminal domain-containing protein n=1 Tax=Cutaneotrichosporon oleaginosum TaxID=879819 RepID=A0A0J0XV42_9TREE|nr:uncharacterized protein CC85DRAFT_283249 [Cutaneotrichosporon oleaginosum]KLT44937.1 hypothetical protein CC85DRAFT_283249 [Cutaneotrichosporon oleaginosum]TXT12063.1 hypothetical protein COLE_02473 [Cutaneotrichosporon oleaginosum]
MAATLMSEHAAPVFTLAPLPFSLDLTCPLPLPSKAVTSPWPFPVAGPSTASDETLESYVTRRYYEVVYLGELLAPLAGLAADWQRASANDGFADVVQRMIVPLSAVEERHRRTLAPVVGAVLSSGNTAAGEARISAAAEAAGLSSIERGALVTGVALRGNSRAVIDGARGVAQRAVSQEFEMREVILQFILLLMYRAARPEPAEPKKKRKKAASPTEDTDAALVHLTDRISLWLAMSELEIEGSKGKSRADNGPAAAVTTLWTILTSFLPREATFLTTFHLEVFGKEIPPGLVAPKKRRKPEITHRLTRRPSPASTASGPTSAAMGRSSSRASAASPPPSFLDLPPKPKRARQFEARPAPKLKRAQSMAARKEAAKAAETVREPGSGLMGRNLGRSQSSIQSTSRSLSRTMSQSQSQSQARRLAKTQSETFVTATPVKANPFRRAVHHPTPIREEPSSAAGSVRSFVAETPTANRIDSSPFVGETPRAPSFVAETPVARRHGPAFIAETPYAPRIASIAETPGGISDDDLAGLMVPTDDEASE